MKKTPVQKPKLVPRPPVVVIMGHIDHGKSTLLGYIKKINITDKEAGGITQHLGAYEVPHPGEAGKAQTITFLDTPGHEAFSGIRSRGVQVADIAILVVSAEDGVKKQTLEALKCIQESNTPYIVAMTKIDKPEANIERTKQALAENEIYIEGYGGTVPAVPVSAVTGEGIPALLDMIILMAELEGLSADPSAETQGVVLEATLDKRKGVSATLIVKEGTLKPQMFTIIDCVISPIRMLENGQGKKVDEATVSTPVKVIGLSTMPVAGAPFRAFVTKKEAEKYNEDCVCAVPTSKNTVQVDETKIVIPVVIKADAGGSLEAIHHEFKKIADKQSKDSPVLVKIVHEGIGEVSENDIKAASGTAGTLILGFNVRIDPKAQSALERLEIKVELFTIIYKLVEYLEEVISARTPKIQVEEVTGKAKILRVFSKNKDRQILGGKVQEGSITLGGDVIILRRDAEIGRGKIKELQQQKVRADEVAIGHEFGTLIESKIEIAVGDKIESYRTVTK
ncbi:translation initiation factor IF-2 [Patescibacteria group bacterium]|nr:MAG: translation initiation factor IF-2 [Patescibacteria group bacterium]